MKDSDKKALFIESLKLVYDDSIHSTTDLNLRAVTGDKGKKIELALEC